MLKKPIALLSPYAHIHYLSTQRQHTLNSFNTAGERNHQRRRYATATQNSESSDFENYIWPRSSVSTSTPTPYEIFRLNKNAPYTKHRFYQLVKIYHPDRSLHSAGSDHISSLPRPIRMERYRLIVTAHEILSDPAKREAYDKTGVGWTGHLDTESYGRHTKYWREASWSGFSANNSPFANATWEDWEKWYERQNGKHPPQAPVYTSNTGFITIVLSAVIIGAVGQRLNIESHDVFFRDQQAQAHDKASEYYRMKVAETQETENINARIHKFLETRDRGGYGSYASAPEYQRRLPAPEDHANKSSSDHG